MVQDFLHQQYYWWTTFKSPWSSETICRVSVVEIWFWRKGVILQGFCFTTLNQAFGLIPKNSSHTFEFLNDFEVKDTPPKTNICPKKRDDFSREYIFQPLIFRGQPLVFRGVISFQGIHLTTYRFFGAIFLEGGGLKWPYYIAGEQKYLPSMRLTVRTWNCDFFPIFKAKMSFFWKCNTSKITSEKEKSWKQHFQYVVRSLFLEYPRSCFFFTPPKNNGWIPEIMVGTWWVL